MIRTHLCSLVLTHFKISVTGLMGSQRLLPTSNSVFHISASEKLSTAHILRSRRHNIHYHIQHQFNMAFIHSYHTALLHFNNVIIIKLLLQPKIIHSRHKTLCFFLGTFIIWSCFVFQTFRWSHKATADRPLKIVGNELNDCLFICCLLMFKLGTGPAWLLTSPLSWKTL